jgi:signal transduction histidine kinase
MTAPDPPSSSRDATSRRLGRVRELTGAVSRAESLREIYELALSCLEQTLGADRTSVLLFDAAGVMRFVAWHGLSDAYRSAVDGHSPWKPGETEAQPILVPDVGEDESLRAFLSVFESEGIRALGFVPLVVDRRLIGKFMLYFPKPHAFEPDEVLLAQIVADQVAFAVGARRNEEALRRSEQRMREAYASARAAEERKDEFVAILSHELRNPLAPIVTALQLMALKGEAAFATERMVIDRQVQHLLRLVDDLLDVSRITRGKLELKRRPVELSTLVERAAELAIPLIEQRGQELAIEVGEGMVVDADPQRLTQVLANLLTNAAKNSPEGGRIVISGLRRDDAIELAVEDEGIGIEPSMLPQLFDLFVQGPQTLGREKGGLGLGLTIVKRLTELHGGTVQVESAGLGKGARFTVSLPAAMVSPAPPPALADETGEHAAVDARLTILVVDDNVDAADTLAEALATAGYATRVAYDGPSALASAAQGAPDVAILDIGLPVMDGYELARRMRESHPRPLRLIALTGYGQPQDRARTAEAGFDVHLVKPVALRELLIAISPPG